MSDNNSELNRRLSQARVSSGPSQGEVKKSSEFEILKAAILNVEKRVAQEELSAIDGFLLEKQALQKVQNISEKEYISAENRVRGMQKLAILENILENRIQELEQLVAIERERGEEALLEAEKAYNIANDEAPAELAALDKQIQGLEESKGALSLEQANLQNKLKASKMQVQRELISKKNLIKELQKFPVAKSFESELQGLQAELRQATKEWKERITPTKRPEETVKPDAQALDKAFNEMRATYTEMITANAGNTTPVEKKEAVEKFDKMSAGFKKGLQMETSQETADLSEQFSGKVQEVEKLAKEERALPLRRSLWRLFRFDREGKRELDSIRKTLSKAKGRAFGATKNLLRKTPQKNSSRGL